jgi:hypothetical protein
VELLSSGHELRGVGHLLEDDHRSVDNLRAEVLTRLVKALCHVIFENLLIDRLQNVLLSREARDEGHVTTQTEIDSEGARFWVHATEEHRADELVALLECFTVIDQLVVDDLAD